MAVLLFFLPLQLLQHSQQVRGVHVDTPSLLQEAPTVRPALIVRTAPPWFILVIFWVPSTSPYLLLPLLDLPLALPCTAPLPLPTVGVFSAAITMLTAPVLGQLHHCPLPCCLLLLTFQELVTVGLYQVPVLAERSYKTRPVDGASFLETLRL